MSEVALENEDEYFQYLDTLRKSGATNMYGAGSYLIREFPSLSKAEAKSIVLKWMETFEKRHPGGQ